MDDNGSKKTMRELRGRINRFIRLTLNDIRVEAKDEFDMNFKREAFFTEKWKRRRVTRMKPEACSYSPGLSDAAYAPG